MMSKCSITLAVVLLATAAGLARWLATTAPALRTDPPIAHASHHADRKSTPRRVPDPAMIHPAAPPTVAPDNAPSSDSRETLSELREELQALRARGLAPTDPGILVYEEAIRSIEEEERPAITPVPAPSSSSQVIP